MERGAAAVEFALLLPLLLLILLGTIDWGYFFFIEQLVTNASREGARAGSLTPFSAGSPSADATAASNATTAAQSYLAAAGLVAASATVSVTSGPQIQVSVSYPTGSITGFTVLTAILPASAQATAVMRR